MAKKLSYIKVKKSFKSQIMDILYYFDLVSVLTAKELKVRYKNSVLGYFWSVLNPLSMALIFLFAFKKVLKIPIENYTFFLICGLFPWQWFSNSVMVSTNILLSNATLIKKTNFSFYIIPLVSVLNDMIHFIMSIPIILALALSYKIWPTIAWIYGILLLTISQFFLTFGISLFVSSLNLFFRDLERIVNIGIMILFYGTPIFYDTSFVPQRYKFFIIINPLAGIIENWRDIFMKNSINFPLFWKNLAYNIIIFSLGFFIFKKLSYKFGEIL